MITLQPEPSEIEILHSVLAELAATGALETPALGITLARLPVFPVDVLDDESSG